MYTLCTSCIGTYRRVKVYQRAEFQCSQITFNEGSGRDAACALNACKSMSIVFSVQITLDLQNYSVAEKEYLYTRRVDTEDDGFGFRKLLDTLYFFHHVQEPMNKLNAEIHRIGAD